MTEKYVIDGFVIPDELSSLVFKVYGFQNYNIFAEPNNKPLTSIKLMLFDIDNMFPDDYRDFKETFKTTPVVTRETAPWLIERGYDCFGWIKKGWIANASIYYKDGYYEALKHMDRNILQYQRKIREDEDKLGIREDNKGTLLERRSWTVFQNKVTEEASEFITVYPTEYGVCEYEHNEIGKIIRRTEISHDGELIYEAIFTYRYYNQNYFLQKYQNTNGIEINYDRIKNEQKGFSKKFG